jgi:hypothetical protein
MLWKLSLTGTLIQETKMKHIMHGGRPPKEVHTPVIPIGAVATMPLPSWMLLCLVPRTRSCKSHGLLIPIGWWSCNRVELDSAIHRKQAHQFYQKHGFENRVDILGTFSRGWRIRGETVQSDCRAAGGSVGCGPRFDRIDGGNFGKVQHCGQRAAWVFDLEIAPKVVEDLFVFGQIKRKTPKAFARPKPR